MTYTIYNGGKNVVEDQLLIIEEVAEMLRIPKAHVYRLARNNTIATIKISQRCTRYSKNSVLGFINTASK